MTDRDIIRAEIERLKECCDYNEENAYDKILSFIDSMEEEPVNRTPDDIESAMQEVEEKSRAFTESHQGENADTILAQMRGEEPVSKFLNTESMIESYKQRLISQANGVGNSPLIDMCLVSYKHGINETLDTLNLSNIERTVKKWKEPVSEDLEEAARNAATWHSRNRGDVFMANDYYKFIAGAQWQKEHLWKPADGDDLPEIDREVIVLTQHYPLKGSEYAVYFAHRPNPDGWDGKSIVTGKTEHYTPKTYDKGGWNIPNVKYWLDCSMPKEIEL